MKTSEIRNLLNVDSVSQKDGVITVRRGFYYRMGGTAGHLVNHVKKNIPGAMIVDSGEIWKPFRGGAWVAAQSHWYVKFTISEIKAALQQVAELYAAY